MVGRVPLGEQMNLCLEPNSAIYWRRKWQPAPVFLPGEPHRQRSLVGYSPGGLQRVGCDWVTEQELLPSYVINLSIEKGELYGLPCVKINICEGSSTVPGLSQMEGIIITVFYWPNSPGAILISLLGIEVPIQIHHLGKCLHNAAWFVALGHCMKCTFHLENQLLCRILNGGEENKTYLEGKISQVTKYFREKKGWT